MKITFVALGSEQLAISLLSAIAKRQGHKVGIAFSASLFNDRFNLTLPKLGAYFDDTPAVIQAIKDQKPDVIAFSVLTSTYQWMLGVAREAKEIFPEVKTIFGGVHVSAVPDRVIARPEVDYVVVGEGDLAFTEILNAIESGRHEKPICNTRFKTAEGKVIRGIQHGFIQDIDCLPAFDKEIWEEHIRIGDLYLTMASRGCPYTCSFCFNNFFHKLPEEKGGKYVRQRSVDHMMNELIYAKERYNIKCIDFQDDVFTVNKTWLKEFLVRYKNEINLPFQCLTHPRYMDDEIAKWLFDAGCTWIQMGVQTMDDEFRKQSLRRYESSQHIVEALEAMNRNGLKPKVDHMFGLPDEPIEAQETARRLYAEQSPKRIQTFWTCFLPGTDLMKEGIEKGIVSRAAAERVYEGIDFYFFRNEENIKNPELVRLYRAYEIMFRIFPFLPRSLRMKIKPKHLGWIPFSIARPVAQFIDASSGMWLGNPEITWYSRHYLFHLYSFFMRSMGFRPPKATKPNKMAKQDLKIFRGKILAENKQAVSKSVA